MINITVFSNSIVEIEGWRPRTIETKQDMIDFLKQLIDKVQYGGEAICLEEATIDNEQGLVTFTTVNRW